MQLWSTSVVVDRETDLLLPLTCHVLGHDHDLDPDLRQINTAVLAAWYNVHNIHSLNHNHTPFQYFD